VETPVTVEVDAVHFNEQDGGFAIVGSDPGAVQAALPSTDGSNSDPVAIDDFAQYEAEPESEDERIKREADSIRFYIDNGYLELAEKAIAEISSNFGERKEVIELHEYLAEYMQLGAGAENLSQNGSPASANGSNISKGIGLHDLRNELGLEEADEQEDSDYDTHYHTAVAYQEMGLLEDAIKEFQEAVGLVNPNDGSRRFFQCANLLGHCFMEKGMPNLALTWYQRALETPALTDDEKQALWYELAAAYEADGDLENAGRYFEQVYAENINFRDVNQRVRNMAVPN
jgi:tetratricopeptide (TPR) repeat protein